MKKAGFSLIELMIVVAIIAFLAMISIPSFMRFLAKAKRAEAYMQLSSIYAAEKSYWAEHGKYTSILSGAGGAGWMPEGYTGGGAQEKFHYTYGFPGAEGQNFFTGKLGTSSSHLSKGYVNDKGFLAIAAADLQGNGKPDILGVDQYNNITIIQDGLG